VSTLEPPSSRSQEYSGSNDQGIKVRDITRMAVTPLYTPVQGAVKSEKRFSRASRFVLALAIALVLLSAAQKVYRLTLPTEGWSTTTDFESDAPIFVENLLTTPSDLRAGDRLVAVEGQDILELQRQALRGQSADLDYRAGETVRYTVLRGGAERELAVPLYPGLSIGLGALTQQFLGGNQVGDPLLLVAVLIVAFVFFKRPNNLTAQLLFVMIAATSASAISWVVSPLSTADSLRTGTLLSAAFFSHWIHFMLEQPLALHVILSFPRPSALLRRRWVLPALYGLPIVAFGAMFALPEPSGLPAFMLVALYNLLGILFVIRMFFTERDAVETAQVRWFGFGFAVSNLGTLVFALSVAGVIPERLALVNEALPYNLVFLVCTAIAILRYRLFDIDVILNRTLVWGGLTAGVVGVYALVVGGLGRLLAVQDDVALSLLATGLIAVAFSPLRERLQRAVNRLLYGGRGEPYAVLTDLSQRLGMTLLSASVLPTMTQTIAHALKLPYVAVVLEHGADPHVVAETGKPTHEPLRLPLIYQTERVGELRLEPRVNETRFGVDELKLLKAIAQQASVAAYAVRLTNELQRSRERLVTTREEERRRLRRDLHDGLGPTLASITLKLDAARNLIHKNPVAADDLLRTLKAQTQAAIGDIRQLVYALRPPALDELGLLGALQEQVRKYEGGGLFVTFRAPDALPLLSAAVEVAAYRVVQEALANVLHHAQASRCEVTVRFAERLELGVTDDGIGISPDYRAGVGLHSMRERAEELGGSFAVTARPQGGTCVTASLPVLEGPGEARDG